MRPMTENPAPVAIVGAGPTGIACAIELGKRGIDAVCYDRGFLLDTLYHFPEEMRWFSTRDLLDIAGVPFAAPEAHPTRLESLAYYRAVAEKFGVKVVPHAAIASIRPREGGGVVLRSDTEDPPSICASAAVIATGFFHNPKKLGVAGEDRPLVQRRYVSGYPFHGSDVVVVGSKNSAAEAALDLYRHGARVTLVARGPAISERVKYWIKPDLENRIKEGSIRAHFDTVVSRIDARSLTLRGPGGETTIENDWVLAMTGYHPDYTFLEQVLRIAIADDPFRTPVFDEATFETSRPGVYLAGTVCGGYRTGRWFIENGRFHARQIMRHIAHGRTDRVPFERIHWKTEE
jgi:thioredoxin reductase (NADPH)